MIDLSEFDIGGDERWIELRHMPCGDIIYIEFDSLLSQAVEVAVTHLVEKHELSASWLKVDWTDASSG